MTDGPSPYQRRRAEQQERLAARGQEGVAPWRPYRLPPEVAKARVAERSRRNSEARRRANLILAERHADEYAALLTEERAALDEEKGPLPGDLAEGES